MQEYYDRRAREYEQIYDRDDPVRQAEQAAIADVLRAATAGRRVLEVACGTGYWTAIIAEAAAQILATDTSQEMLAIAQKKNLPPGKVEFRLADAYQLAKVPGTFDAGVAMFWLSHVPINRLQEFLQQFHARLEPASAVVMADNIFVPGLGGELISQPVAPDTFKLRTLSDGSAHVVVKNYYDSNELHETLAPWAVDNRIHVGRCFWWAGYRTAAQARRARGRSGRRK